MSTRVCPYCGTPDYGTHFCLSCQRPLVRDPEAELEPLAGEPRESVPISRAGFFRRLGAFAIDWLTLSILGDLLYLAYKAGWQFRPEAMRADVPPVLLVVLFLLYFTLLTGEGGQTLGKLLVGIRVQRTDGTPVRFGRAFIRTLGYFVSFFFMTFLGFLWVIWDRKKQGWHDKIAGTEVIRV